MKPVHLLAFGLVLLGAVPGKASPFRMIDDTPGNVSCAVDGGRVFVLKDNGNVWEHHEGSRNRIDDGLGTRKIAADSGFVYAIKKDGRVCRRHSGEWQAIGRTSSRQCVAAGSSLYAIESCGDVYRYTYDWSRLSSGERLLAVAADRQQAIHALTESGEVLHHQASGGWERLRGPVGRDIATGAGRVYVIGRDDTLWRYTGEWKAIGSVPGARQIKADAHTVYVLKTDGVWMHRDEKWTHLDAAPRTLMIDARDGQLVVMKETGVVWLLEPRSDRRRAAFAKLHGEK